MHGRHREVIRVIRGRFQRGPLALMAVFSYMPFTVANVIGRFNSGSGEPPRTVALIARAGLGLWRAELFTTDYLESVADKLLLSEFPGYVNLLGPRAQTILGGSLMLAGVSRDFRSQLVRGVRPDVVHLHGIWSPYLGAYAAEARRNGIPYIVASHGLLERGSLQRHSWRKALALNTFQGHILRKASAIHTASELEARHLRSLGYTDIPIYVIPNAVDDSAHVSEDASAAAPENRVLLFLSNLQQGKGVETLLATWNALRPEGWELLIVGGGASSHTESLQRYCRAHSLPGVRFQANVKGEEREAMFAQAAAFVLPAYRESIGSAVGEALVRGLPVITTTRTPWSVVAEHNLGWYIKPAADRLRRALSELFAKDHSALRAMGERGHAYARANLLVDAIRPRLQQMYQSTIRH